MYIVYTVQATVEFLFRNFNSSNSEADKER